MNGLMRKHICFLSNWKSNSPYGWHVTAGSGRQIGGTDTDYSLTQDSPACNLCAQERETHGTTYSRAALSLSKSGMRSPIHELHFHQSAGANSELRLLCRLVAASKTRPGKTEEKRTGLFSSSSVVENLEDTKRLCLQQWDGKEHWNDDCSARGCQSLRKGRPTSETLDGQGQQGPLHFQRPDQRALRPLFCGCCCYLS